MQRLVRLATAAALTIAVLLGVAGTAAASSPDGRHFPVHYSFTPGILSAIAHPTADPPGANDWDCKPTAKHPNPVILVHGLLATKGDNWQTFSPMIADAGYCVYALTYGQGPNASHPGAPFLGGLGRIEDSAQELKAFVAKVQAATGAAKVDLVGHSEGATMPHYYIKYLGGDAQVQRYVNLAPIYDGTTLFGVSSLNDLAIAFGFEPVIDGVLNPVCASCKEFLKGSDYNKKMRSGAGIFSPNVTYTNIVTKFDELVIPYTSGIAQGPNITNFTVQDQCPLDFSEHLSLIADPTSGADVLNALDPSRHGTVPCQLVLPVIGASLF